MQDLVVKIGELRLEPFTGADIGLIENLWQDPRVARFISMNPNDWTDASARAFVHEAIEHQEQHGFSRWKVSRKDGTFLGWAGYSASDETSEIELDYCLSIEAIEKHPQLPERLCRELIDWFFDNTYFSHLVAVVRTDNKLVREAMMDSGFYYRESKRVDGMPCDVFQVLSPSMQTYVMSA